jgi:hypothetical protein
MSNNTPQQQDWSLEEIRDIFNMPLMELVCTLGQMTTQGETGSPIPFSASYFFSSLNMNARLKNIYDAGVQGSHCPQNVLRPARGVLP